MDSGSQNPKGSDHPEGSDQQATPELPPTPKQEECPASTERKSQVNGAETVVQSDPEKAKLEVEKLRLEVDSLRFKRSGFGRAIELFQIVSPFVAIAALVWTIYINSQQQKQLRLDAENSRLQQAYTRLGGQLPAERSSGVAELSALLGAENGTRDGEVLTALVGALVLDSNAEVRSSILRVFKNLKGNVNKSAIDAALRSAIDIQRAEIRSSQLYPFELATMRPEGRGAFSYFPITGDDISPYRRQQTTASQQAIVENLVDLSKVFLDFLKAGGHVNDMSGIFCFPRCDFSSLNSNFDNVDFHGAVLVGSVWQFAEVNHANFDDALLEQADFTGAHLRGTTFGQEPFDLTRKWFVEVEPRLDDDVFTNESAGSTNDLNQDNATFACSDLQGASFKHFAIMVRMDKNVPSDYSLSEYFDDANIEGADFTTVREVVVRPGTESLPAGRSYQEDKIKVGRLVLAIGDSDVEDAPLLRPGLGYKDMKGIGALLDLAKNPDSAKLAGPKTTLKVIHQRRNSKTFHAVDCKKLLEDHRKATETAQ